MHTYWAPLDPVRPAPLFSTGYAWPIMPLSGPHFRGRGPSLKGGVYCPKSDSKIFLFHFNR